MNKKTTSKGVASKAAKALANPNTSKIQKSLAASAMAQVDKSKQTGKEMESKASAVLKSDKYSEDTQEFAASVLAQSNKSR
ncbi:hypothetical protein C9I92_10755 [Photobacterium ganghwense]|uniref:Uncharacterized protein n=1 Tax=Photobacterium ganghwense TaxID=320778 RepID=A0A0J1H0C9_9GAMM|nr:hypothetical protein [Photobacterium ganghwense]USN27155.1 hypothetical protein [synthetic construct]KLV05254.1 hypothetical protein ABT57_21600 [Photobacterium ganghwense]PSU08014.1 hypothetical protein C9I92_10750 [Photobacterium ganghwense]PSU08015.1 hypothetical protein C9I92_10755 [Photobacterium ganghwense]USN27156.1 hypothetical protein [synthetic construct]